jgi:DNA polymerase III subunit epsilon
MTRRKKSTSKGEAALIALIIGGIGLLIVGLFKGLFELLKGLFDAISSPSKKTPQYIYPKTTQTASVTLPTSPTKAIEPPIERGNVPQISFVAIDFETANRRRGSACDIGMCKVLNGEVVERYVKLLQPEPFEFESGNVYVHGITAEMTEYAPTIAEDWDNIQAFVGDLRLVAHNASFDRSVLDNSLIASGLAASGWKIDCTLKQAKQVLVGRVSYKLSNLSNEFGISLHHHDAGSDAEACARLHLVLSSMTPFKIEKEDPSVSEVLDIKSDTLKGLTLVFTGEFDEYTRAELEDLAKSHSAFVRNSVSGKTNYVIKGDISHSGKLTKAYELNVPILTLKKFLGMIEKPKKRAKAMVS